MNFKEYAKFDLIAIGRAGVDLYAEQANTDFEEVSSFKKYVGGSPANITSGMSVRGAKVGLISQVANDMLGRYTITELQSLNVDTSHVKFGPEGSRTSLAITEMKPHDCGVVIFRNDAADFFITPQDIDESYIASSKTLLISGTALAQSPSREAVFRAVEIAHRNNVKVIFDIDYRPYSWLTQEEAAVYTSLLAEKSHIIIGNREEFDVLELHSLKGNKDDKISAQAWFKHCAEIVIVKRGGEGSLLCTRKNETIEGPIFKVPHFKKPFGAGDAFAANFIYELLQNNSLETALKQGAAAASYNIMGESCSRSNPTTAQLIKFIDDYKEI